MVDYEQEPAYGEIYILNGTGGTIGTLQPTHIQVQRRLTSAWDTAELDYFLQSALDYLPSVYNTIVVRAKRASDASYNTIFYGNISDVERDRAGIEEDAHISAVGQGRKMKWRALNMVGTLGAAYSISTALLKPITDAGLLGVSVSTNVNWITEVEDIERRYVWDEFSRFCEDEGIDSYVTWTGTIRIFPKGGIPGNKTFDTFTERSYAESDQDIFNTMTLYSYLSPYEDEPSDWAENTTGTNYQWKMNYKDVVEDDWILGNVGKTSIGTTLNTWNVMTTSTEAFQYMWCTFPLFNLFSYPYGTIFIAVNRDDAYPIVPKGPRVSVYLTSTEQTVPPTQYYLGGVFGAVAPSAGTLRNWLPISLNKKTLNKVYESPLIPFFYSESLAYDVSCIGIEVDWSSCGAFGYQGSMAVDGFMFYGHLQTNYENTASSDSFGLREFIPAEKAIYDHLTPGQLGSVAARIIDPMAVKEVTMRKVQLPGTHDVLPGHTYGFAFPDGTLTYGVTEIEHDIDGNKWDTVLTLSDFTSKEKEPLRRRMRAEANIDRRLEKLEEKVQGLKYDMGDMQNWTYRIVEYKGEVLPDQQTLNWDNVFPDLRWQHFYGGVPYDMSMDKGIVTMHMTNDDWITYFSVGGSSVSYKGYGISHYANNPIFIRSRQTFDVLTPLDHYSFFALDVKIYATLGTQGSMYVGLGSWVGGGDPPKPGYYLRLTDTTGDSMLVYGWLSHGGGGGTESVLLDTVSVGTYNVLAAEHIPSETIVNYYVNETLKGSFTGADATFASTVVLKPVFLSSYTNTPNTVDYHMFRLGWDWSR